MKPSEGAIILTDRPPPQLTMSLDNETANKWFRHLRGLVESGAPIKAVFTYLYRRLDSIMAADVNPHLACKRGCSYCCHVAVTITPAEALHIEQMTGHTANFDDAAYYTPKDMDAMGHPACVFLKSGECSIYEVRPSVCRIFGSFSDPELYCKDGATEHHIFRLDAPEEGQQTIINWMVYTALIGLAARRAYGFKIKDIRQFFGGQ
jgi:Fe-S-cluster containining protein